MRKIIYKIFYRILKKDMIRKLKAKSYGEQFIDSVMEAFEIPTNFMSEYYSGLKNKENLVSDKTIGDGRKR